MSKPKVPEPDWEAMWSSYSGWNTDTSVRQSREMSMAQASMARGGVKAGSDAWERNLNNVAKEQAKERRTLRTGTTATELQGKRSPLKVMSQMDYGNMRDMAMYKGIQEAKQSHQKAYQAYSEGGYKASEDPGDRDKLITEAATKSVKNFGETAKKQYDKAEWFQPTYQITGQGAEGEGGYKRQTGEALTPGGALRMQELTSSSDNLFGRKLEPWEAVGFLKYGTPGTGKTEAEQSAEKAAAAGSGQRQAGRDRASAASDTVQRSTTASPWTVAQEEALF